MNHLHTRLPFLRYPKDLFLSCQQFSLEAFISATFNMMLAFSLLCLWKESGGFWYTSAATNTLVALLRC
jgi:hypothetical protein